MARSAAFEEFLAVVNAPLVFTRDALDEIPGIGVFYSLGDEERIEAEDILIAMLARNDGRVAAFLAEAYCERAVPALIEATTEAAAPVMRVFAARALLEMDSQAGRPGIERMLRAHAGSGFDRGSAVRLLAEFPDPDLELLLDVAATDPDDIARSEATHAALSAVGLDDEELTSGEVLLSVGGRLLSSLPSVRNEALAELRAILAGWADGRTAEDLGLTWHLDRGNRPLHRFIDAFESRRPEFPLEGLLDLTGRERTLLENLVLLRLHADRRAVRAAARLNVHRAIEPLRELLPSAKGPAREEIETVLAALTG
ncbi:HEAT repeat domain-containing protein [Spongiactinospora sp. TRM90649]|uniref:HEAT repeat domain-containing protein n=1 Tax=Spongiactinospora sp. TRM90649 TaxID=3031114 RepID=UPI0023F8FE7D|nr:HEAT repeat domain-containing protein [Spongiactinospora sp. TRM90649]MDF5754213.1 HEAT repeat domain-containing protein [Spongiactinospora sp. TRM90649]